MSILGARTRTPIALAGVLLLAACASQTLQQGAKLAEAGQAAATRMERSAVLSGDAISDLRRAVAFNDGYNGLQGNARSADFLKHMDSIQAREAQYAHLLESLAAAYGAMGDLARYDASGAFNTAFQHLAGDSTALVSALDPAAAGVAPSLKIAGALGGAAVGQAQARRVRVASAKIKVVLDRVIPVLIAKEHLLVPAQEQVAGQLSQASDLLLENGVYGWSGVADSLGAPMGLKSYSGTETAIAANTPGMAKVRSGLRAVALQMAEEQPAKVRAAYEASVRSLQALSKMHEQLAHGAPLNVEQLAAAAAELDTLADALAPAASGAKPEMKAK